MQQREIHISGNILKLYTELCCDSRSHFGSQLMKHLDLLNSEAEKQTTKKNLHILCSKK